MEPMTTGKTPLVGGVRAWWAGRGWWCLWALFVVFVQWVNGGFDGAALSYVVVVAGLAWALSEPWQHDLWFVAEAEAFSVEFPAEWQPAFPKFVAAVPEHP